MTENDTVPVTYVNAAPPIHQYTITLITGDILYVTKSDKGTWSVAVKEAPRTYGTVPFETFSDSQRGTYAIPVDVVSLVPNTLDPNLFNLDYITENHLNDESASVLGAIAQYAPGVPPSSQWYSDSVQYSNLSIVNSQVLAIPKEDAADFGRHILSRSLSLPYGIEKIWLNKVYRVSLDQSVPMIGGDAARNVLGYNGSGINIAILDTGIDATHPDFFFANGTSKVIVRIDATCMAEPRLFCDHTTKDGFGHGTHVASIAAGTGAASGGRYTGVAPGASLMNIKVINSQGVGFLSWVILGLQLAAQGVNGVKADVISMSLGGGPSDGLDPLSQAVNQVVSTYGIPVVIAAGNSGCYFCVSSPGAADGAITVAATTKTRSTIIETSPTSRSFLGDPMQFSVPIPKEGITTRVVDAGLGLSSTDFPANTPGNIALIQRGQTTFRSKALNAANAGAVAAVIYNNAPGSFLGTLISPGIPIPVVSMSQEDGLALKADVNAGLTTVNLANGPPSIASFSNRGPRMDNFDVKPDISAPGVVITAACSSTAFVIGCPRGSHYVTLSGTSMATPHISGSVALLLQQANQRGIKLTPAEIKDILQSNSNVIAPPLPGQPDVDIYQQGAGLVRIDHALEASVVFNSSEISFGSVPYPTPSVQHTFQVMNLGITTVSLNLSYEMTDVQTRQSPFGTGSTYTKLVSLSQNMLTIAAGGSASVTLTINLADAPTQKLWEIFSGRIFATSGNTTVAHAIFGLAKEGPRQTVHLTGINPAGSDLIAFQEFSVYDALDPLGFENFFLNVDSNGHATLRLPPTSYNFMMETITARLRYFDGFTSFYYFSYYRIVALEVPVTTSPANVTLDASNALPVNLNLQADPSATNGLQQDETLDYIRPDGSQVQFATSILGQTWLLYAVNNASAKLGTFWTYDRWLVTRSPAPTSPVLYDISMTDHTQQPTTHTVSDLSALAKTYASYHSETPTGGTFGRWTFPMAFNQDFGITSFYPVAAGQRVEYHQATEVGYRQFFDPYWIMGYPYLGGCSLGENCFEPWFWFESPVAFNYFGSNQLGRVDAAGEPHNETWAAMPVHPMLTLAERLGDSLILSGFEVTDNFGHFGAYWDGWGVNFHMSVYVDGVLSTVRDSISSLNPNNFPPDANKDRILFVPVNVSLPRKSTNVEVAMQMQPVRAAPYHGWTTLSTNVTSDIVFRTDHGQQGPIPLPTYNYDIKGLNVLNSAQLDNSETFQVNVALRSPNGGVIRPMEASAQIALNGGTIWTSARVINLGSGGLIVTARIPATGHGYTFWVSLRISVVTAHGIAYTQKIVKAFEVVS